MSPKRQLLEYVNITLRMLKSRDALEPKQEIKFGQILQSIFLIYSVSILFGCHSNSSTIAQNCQEMSFFNEVSICIPKEWKIDSIDDGGYFLVPPISDSLPIGIEVHLLVKPSVEYIKKRLNFMKDSPWIQDVSLTTGEPVKISYSEKDTLGNTIFTTEYYYHVGERKLILFNAVSLNVQVSEQPALLEVLETIYCCQSDSR